MISRPITVDEALAIHSAAIARFGGVDGVRDAGLLDSALAQPFQSFGGVELYPTAQEKAARCAFGIIENHPFIDGNKRTAAAVMGAILRMSGLTFQPAHADLLHAVLSVADGTWGYDELASWVQANVVQ